MCSLMSLHIISVPLHYLGAPSLTHVLASILVSTHLRLMYLLPTLRALFLRTSHVQTRQQISRPLPVMVNQPPPDAGPHEIGGWYKALDKESLKLVPPKDSTPAQRAVFNALAQQVW